MEIPKVEIERIRENLQRQRELGKLLSATPEFQEQSAMFRSWVALCGIGYAKVEDGIGLAWCPKHNRFEKLQLECGLSIKKATELLAEKIPKHASECKRVRKQIKKNHPELEMIEVEAC